MRDKRINPQAYIHKGSPNITKYVRQQRLSHFFVRFFHKISTYMVNLFF